MRGRVSRWNGTIRVAEKVCKECRTAHPIAEFFEGRYAAYAYCYACRRVRERKRHNARNADLRATTLILRPKLCVICQVQFTPPKSMNQITCSPACQKERCRRIGRKSRLYLTLEQYAALLKAQDSRCLTCGIEGTNLAVDHCHTTGEIRGLLCRNCNLALGFIKERSAVALALADYIVQRCDARKVEAA